MTDERHVYICDKCFKQYGFRTREFVLPEQGVPTCPKDASHGKMKRDPDQPSRGLLR